MNQIKVLVIEDEPIIAEDIYFCLTNDDFEVVGTAYKVSEALDLLKITSPDIVLLDINLNGDMDGIEIAEYINQNYHLPFVFLTSYADKATIARAKHTAPCAYIVKPFKEADLIASLEIGLFNFSRRSPKISWNIEDLQKQLQENITPKEFEILQDIYEGKTNKQICERHFLSLNTIKTHVRNLYMKLDVHSRSAAVAKIRSLVSS